MKFVLNKNKKKNNKMPQSDQPNPANLNPYLDRSNGKRIWNDRYLNLSQARKHWQLACLALFVINFILLLLTIKLSTASTIKPFVVELSRGMPIGIAKPLEQLPSADKLIQYSINEFITSARTILGDAQAEKSLLDKTYAFSANDTLNFLRDYYTHHNPFEKAETATVSVVILNSLKIGANTWQVTWDEVEKSRNGGAICQTSRYLGTLTLLQSAPNAKFLTTNPFGIYVTALSWSKIQ